MIQQDVVEVPVWFVCAFEVPSARSVVDLVARCDSMVMRNNFRSVVEFVSRCDSITAIELFPTSR